MNTTLYFREGSSDKVYHASIESKDNGHVVNFAYGRRGATLTTGTKTNTPVSYDAAKAIYDKLVKEKMAKGYTPGESGTPYEHAEKTDSGIRCQLLNVIEETALPELLAGFDYWMQQKMDGVRILLHKKNGTIQGINRKGVVVALPADLIAECTRYAGDFLLDGEMIGDIYHAFDLLEMGTEDLRDKRFGERYLWLLNFLSSFLHPSIQRVETAVLPKYKQELFNRLQLEEREGVVFKQVNAPYTAGRPASGGTQLKYKFVETASFIVSAINAKRSVGLSLQDGNQPVFVGNVTIPANHQIPAWGAIVEVRYLYAFRGGSIFQPVYLGVRNDLTPDDCTLDQLKYKPEALAA